MKYFLTEGTKVSIGSSQKRRFSIFSAPFERGKSESGIPFAERENASAMNSHPERRQKILKALNATEMKE